VSAVTSSPSTAPASQPATVSAAAPHGAAARANLVSNTLRPLERWVAWSIALYTAWLAAFAFPGVPALWLFVLYAGLVGKWAEARPARRQSEMSLRGVALVAGAYVLHTHISPELGGPAGPFFFWISITCMYYALMLKPAWAAGIVGLALLELAASFLQLAALGSPSEFMVRAGFLCIFSLLLAMRFGAALRAPDEALETGRIDGSTSLYNMAGLMAHGNCLLAACHRDKRPLTVAVFDCADLIEVREIYGSRIARKLMERTVSKFNILCADHGLAARTGPAEFTVVLPGADREKALAAIARVLGSPTRIELDAGDSEIVMVPGYRVRTAADTESCVAQVHQELRHELTQIEHTEQLRRRYLQRERESHSKPAGLRATGAAPSPHDASTMPAPLVIS